MGLIIPLFTLHHNLVAESFKQSTLGIRAFSVAGQWLFSIIRRLVKEPALVDSCPFWFPTILANKYCCCPGISWKLLPCMHAVTVQSDTFVDLVTVLFI